MTSLGILSELTNYKRLMAEFNVPESSIVSYLALVLT